jgi:hypothetical protein
MPLLHYVPRFSPKPDYKPDVLEAFTGRRTSTLAAFVEFHRARFSAPFTQ